MLRSAGDAVRLGWLVVGAAALLFLGLEAAYRAQAAVRRLIAGERANPVPTLDPSHPYADSAWFPELVRERSQLAFRWEPFVYSRHRPFKGRFVTSDSAGFRPVPRFPVPGGKPLRVFEFGGSTTWGFFDRDNATRSATVARRLSTAGFDAEVVNYGQLGYVSAQELLALVLQLRRGNVPDVVVFWDGVNDVLAARMNGRPGVSYREFERAQDADFNAKRRANDLRVDDALAVRSLVLHSELLTRLLTLTRPRPPAPPVPEPTGFCRTLMADWLQQARLIDNLANAYGFLALVIWQPQWETSGRPRSEFERKVAYSAVATPTDTLVGAHRIECARVADSLVAFRAAQSIVSLAHLHSEDTGTVYLDRYGHTGERTTAIEGDTVAALIIAKLKTRFQSRDHGPAPDRTRR